MVQQDMKKAFRRIAFSTARMEAGLRKSHDKFYRKCVKGKRNDMIRQVDNFLNMGQSEDDLKRRDSRNSASANYLTPFSTG